MQIRFRNTVVGLMIFWGLVPVLVMSTYLFWQFNVQAVEQGTEQLNRENRQISVELERVLLQVQNQLIRLSEQGAIVKSATVSFMSQKAVAQMEELRRKFPIIDAVVLLDIDQFQMETSPEEILKVDFSDLEEFLNGLLFHHYNLTLESASPRFTSFYNQKLAEISLRDNQAQYLAIAQPIIRATDSLSQPYVTDGALLITINLDALVKQLAAKANIDLSSTRVAIRSNEATLFETNQTLDGSIIQTFTEADYSLMQGNPQLFIELNRSQSTLKKRVRSTIRALVPMLVIFMIGVVISASAVARKLTQPISLLQRATWTLARGNFAQIEPFSQFKEFRDLSDLLSDMGETIERQISQLNSARLDLESKVNERTKELQDSIAQLKHHGQLLQGLMQVTVDMQRSPDIDTLLNCSLAELHSQFRHHRSVIVLNRTSNHEAYDRLSSLPESDKQFLNSQLQNWRNQDFDFRTDLHNDMNWTLVPIRNAERQVIGQLIIVGPLMSELERDVIFIMTRLMATILDQISLTLKLEKLANTDALTNLANRHFFESQFKAMKKKWHDYQTPIGVIVIDLNRLKTVNDRYGHEMGDLMIKTTAQKLMAICRESDIIARVGGDEFYILLHDANKTACQQAAERLNEAAQQLLLNTGTESDPELINVSFSLGYACTDTDPIDALITLADQRMYKAKQAFRSVQ